MRIVWIGFHIEGISAFTALLEEGYNIVACISLSQIEKQKRSGVGNYENFCNKNDIPYYETNHVNLESTKKIIISYSPDLLIVLGWSQILDEEVLRIPKIGSIGAHASLLPSLRGSAPINWAIIKGMETTGNTLLWLNPEVDTGEVIEQKSFKILPYDTCETLYEKVACTNKEMLLKMLPIIYKKGKVGRRQINTGTLLPRRKPSDGLIDFYSSSLDIYNFIRALTKPYPGAFAYYSSKLYYFWNASRLHNKLFFVKNAKAGQVLDHLYSPDPNACGIVVACGNEESIIINKIEECNGRCFIGPDLFIVFKINTYFNAK